MKLRTCRTLLATGLVSRVGGSGGGGISTSTLFSVILLIILVFGASAGATFAFSVLRRFLFCLFNDHPSIAVSSSALRFLDFFPATSTGA